MVIVDVQLLVDALLVAVVVGNGASGCGSSSRNGGSNSSCNRSRSDSRGFLGSSNRSNKPRAPLAAYPLFSLAAQV